MAKDIQLEEKSVTIASAAALSGLIDLTGWSIVSILIPSWTAADLTFQGSIDGSTFKNIYTKDGIELSATVVADSIICDLLELGSIRYLKIRSGTSGTPVNQGAERVLGVLLKR